MERKGQSQNTSTARQPYEPPQLREYGSLSRIVQAKPGGSHDSLTCGNTKTTP